MGAANEFIRESTNPQLQNGISAPPFIRSLRFFVLYRINSAGWIRAFADQCKAGEDGTASRAP